MLTLSVLFLFCVCTMDIFKSLPFKGLCPQSVFFLSAIFYQLFPMRSDCLQQAAAQRKAERPASFFTALHLFVQTLQSLQVENLSTFQKCAGDITVILFLFPGLGNNIHHIFVSYRSCPAPTAYLL